VAGPVAVQTGMVIAYIWALLALRHLPESESNPTLCLLYAPVEIISTALAWLASRAVAGRMRRGWTLIAAGMACSAIVNLDWVWLAFDPTHHFSWPIYIVAYAQYPLAFWAFASFPRAGANVDRKTHLLDAAIVLVAAAVLAWHFVFSEILTRSGAGALATLRALAYTVLCLTVLFGAVALYVQRPARRLSTPLGLLIGAWAILTLANTLQMRATVLKLPLSGFTLNACFAVAASLVAVAAALFSARAVADFGAKEFHARQAPSWLGPVYSLLPSAAIAAVFAVLLRQVRYAATQPSHVTTAPLTALVVGAMAITLLVVLRQISAQRRNAALQAHFGALVEHASDVVLVVDATGIVREASPSVAHTLGHLPQTLVGRALANLVAPDDRALVHADFAQITNATTVDGRPRPSAPCEWRVVHADGAVRWLEVLGTNLVHDPAVCGVVINGRDVSERKALEIELTHRAYHDALTGLVNQARFRKLVEEALDRREASSSAGRDTRGDLSDRTSVAVLYIDLDEFKPVNDSLGHGAGDRVLEVVTERLLDATRGSDVVARVGGDEFAVLLEHVRDVDEAKAVARRVLERIQQPLMVDGATVVVGASIGIACTRIDDSPSRDENSVLATTCEVLLRDADEAMYLAKARGGRRYEMYTG